MGDDAVSRVVNAVAVACYWLVTMVVCSHCCCLMDPQGWNITGAALNIEGNVLDAKGLGQSIGVGWEELQRTRGKRGERKGIVREPPLVCD